MKKAVLYCRVSSEKQATEGHGLSSQESSCRRYAQEHDYTVEHVFHDDATGGGDFWKRPGLCKLLEYLEAQDEEHAVIFDDLKHFARDTFFHLKLRKELSSRNAYPRCPNFRFEDTPEGEFIETIIAATGELERKQNRRQVISRMKARLEAGHWVFHAPLGYRHTGTKSGKRVTPDHPTSEHVTAALEGFASGKLPRQVDVAAFLRKNSCITPWSRGKTFSYNGVQALLSNPFYAGWCICKKWDIRVRGQHEPLISEATHQRILERLQPTLTTFTRHDIREDFPLRGFIFCEHCGRQLTSGWTQGRNQKYPYYRCQTKSCLGGIARDTLEEQFITRLIEAIPTTGIFRLFDHVLRESFADRHKLRAERTKTNRDRLNHIEHDISVLVDSVARTDNPGVRQVYEEKIASLHDEQERLKAQSNQTPNFELAPVLDRGRQILQNPVRSWRTGNLQRRRSIQSLAFQHPIRYDRENTLCTAEFSLVYRLFEVAKGGEQSVVDLVEGHLHQLVEQFMEWPAHLHAFK